METRINRRPQRRLGWRASRRSSHGVQFRQWATERLNEYLAKDFTLDDERLKNPPGPGTKTISTNYSSASAISVRHPNSKASLPALYCVNRDERGANLVAYRLDQSFARVAISAEFENVICPRWSA